MLHMQHQAQGFYDCFASTFKICRKCISECGGLADRYQSVGATHKGNKVIAFAVPAYCQLRARSIALAEGEGKGEYRVAAR